jgi:hypothetical protein
MRMRSDYGLPFGTEHAHHQPLEQLGARLEDDAISAARYDIVRARTMSGVLMSRSSSLPYS